MNSYIPKCILKKIIRGMNFCDVSLMLYNDHILTLTSAFKILNLSKEYWNKNHRSIGKIYLNEYNCLLIVFLIVHISVGCKPLPIFLVEQTFDKHLKCLHCFETRNSRYKMLNILIYCID